MVRIVGFTCSYTPLPLIHAAGFATCRILPVTKAEDQAGSMLHDNMCPHVKRVLDRALGSDLPGLEAMVFMNSCESMRRLADVWKRTRSGDRQLLVDLPATPGDGSVRFLSGELRRLWAALGAPQDPGVCRKRIAASVQTHNRLVGALDGLRDEVIRRAPAGGRALLQKAFDLSVSGPPETTMSWIEEQKASLAARPPSGSGLPVYLFGNVLPGEEAFDLLERSGCRIVGDSLCTGTHQLRPFSIERDTDPFRAMAQDLLDRPACARTVAPESPDRLAHFVVEQARSCGARAVIGHVMKFCDPYLARIPAIREELSRAGLPVLVLEGDCTVRSLGQSRTRLQAFVEMLG